MFLHCINWKKLVVNRLKKLNLQGLFVLRTAPFMFFWLLIFSGALLLQSCKKNETEKPASPQYFELNHIKFNGISLSTLFTNAPLNPTFKINFSKALDTAIAKKEILIKEGGYNPVSVQYSSKIQTQPLC